MKFFSDFGNGFRNCFKAFSLLFEEGLWPYLFYPLLIWLVVWVGTLHGFMALADYLTGFMKSYLSIENPEDHIQWVSFIKTKLTGIFTFMVSWVLKLIFWYVGSVFSKYVLLIVLSPLFSLLSEKTDEKINGFQFPFHFIQLLKNILRGGMMSLRNLMMELMIGFALWLIAIFFPPLFFLTFPLSILIGWYYIGFSIIDYNCERHQFGVRKSIQLMRKNRGYVIGIGCVFSIFMLLPTLAGSVLGIMFGSTLAVIGATVSFHHIKAKEISSS